jgi:hypothetical protein
MGMYAGSLAVGFVLSFFITEDLRRQREEKMKRMDKMLTAEAINNTVNEDSKKSALL